MYLWATLKVLITLFLKFFLPPFFIKLWIKLVQILTDRIILFFEQWLNWKQVKFQIWFFRCVVCVFEILFNLRFWVEIVIRKSVDFIYLKTFGFIIFIQKTFIDFQFNMILNHYFSFDSLILILQQFNKLRIYILIIHFLIICFNSINREKFFCFLLLLIFTVKCG